MRRPDGYEWCATGTDHEVSPDFPPHDARPTIAVSVCGVYELLYQSHKYA
ncbi:hypothetical protein ACQPYK_40015 [Streptosporangium sp. CA-135522]